MKPPLLFLCHRIPYPPDKGDKIRSYHMLQYLCEHYSVYLGAFVDDKSDWTHAPYLKEMCEECCFIEINKNVATVKSMLGLVSAQPLSIPYYSNKKLSDWVRRCSERIPNFRLVAFSAAMAQFALDADLKFEKKIVDIVDVDSDKWRQYALKKSWPMSWVYRREADYLLQFEILVTKVFDTSLFVSNSEADLFRKFAPSLVDKIGFLNNGVDSQYFCRSVDRENPYAEGDNVLVFTGAMDYWPNIDAVSWFAKKVLPDLLNLDASLRFYIVGSNPAASVRLLENLSGVVVTGRVEDVRPYLQYAVAAVAPMRIARGIQNKVLEAMAMELPVIVSSKGLEGIPAISGKDVLLAEHPSDYRKQLAEMRSSSHFDIGRSARELIVREFNWSRNLSMLVQLLGNDQNNV